MILCRQHAGSTIKSIAQKMGLLKTIEYDCLLSSQFYFYNESAGNRWQRALSFPPNANHLSHSRPEELISRQMQNTHLSLYHTQRRRNATPRSRTTQVIRESCPPFFTFISYSSTFSVCRAYSLKEIIYRLTE